MVHGITVDGSPARRLGTVTLTADVSSNAPEAAQYAWTVSEGWTISGAATGPTVKLTAPNEYDRRGSAAVTVTVHGRNGSASAAIATRGYQPPDVSRATISPELIVEIAEMHGDPANINDHLVEYTWTIGGLVVASGMQASWSNPGLPGVYEASVVAIDPEGASDTKTFTLTLGSGAPWPTAGRDLQHTGRQTQGALQPAGLTVWEYFGPGIQNNPIVGAGGRIYAGSWNNGFGGGISAVTSAGLEAWSYAVTEGAHNYLENYGAPVLSADGYLYHAPWNGNLTKLNAATGALVWEYYTGKNFDNHSPKIAADGSIVTSTQSGVIAVKPDGTLKWSFNGGTSYANNIAIGQNGTIYAVSNAWPNQVVALRPADGELLWANPITGQVQYGNLAVNGQGQVVASTDSGWLFQFNPDGTYAWAVEFDRGTTKGIAIGADDTIYYVDSGAYLHAVNSDGTERWRLGIGTNSGMTPSIGSDGTIYAADATSMTAVNPDKTRKWWVPLSSGSEAQPAIGFNGVIYYGLYESLVAIE